MNASSFSIIAVYINLIILNKATSANSDQIFCKQMVPFGSMLLFLRSYMLWYNSLENGQMQTDI